MTIWMEAQHASPMPNQHRDVICYGGRHPSMRVAGPIGRIEPQAFLARLGAGSGELEVHFHPVDQFQFIVKGSGRLASHDVSPGFVHYADRFQPYGPINPGGAGLAFLTLRGVSDAGAHYMPGAQETLTSTLRSLPESASARRNISVDLGGEQVPSDGGWRDVGGYHEDAMAIRLSVVPEGSRVDAVEVSGAGGYLVVVAGSLRNRERSLDAGSVRWYPAGKSTDQLEPGGAGARLALLQLPNRPGPVDVHSN